MRCLSWKIIVRIVNFCARKTPVLQRCCVGSISVMRTGEAAFSFSLFMGRKAAGSQLGDYPKYPSLLTCSSLSYDGALTPRGGVGKRCQCIDRVGAAPLIAGKQGSRGRKVSCERGSAALKHPRRHGSELGRRCSSACLICDLATWFS